MISDVARGEFIQSQAGIPTGRDIDVVPTVLRNRADLEVEDYPSHEPFTISIQTSEDAPPIIAWEAIQNKTIRPSNLPFLRLAHAVSVHLQTDGNFTVYRGDTRKTNCMWHSGTWRSYHKGEDCELRFQGDGNLAIYVENAAVWSTGTQGRGQTLLFSNENPFMTILDRNRVPIWNTTGIQRRPKDRRSVLENSTPSHFVTQTLDCETQPSVTNWDRQYSEQPSQPSPRALVRAGLPRGVAEL